MRLLLKKDSKLEIRYLQRKQEEHIPACMLFVPIVYFRNRKFFNISPAYIY